MFMSSEVRTIAQVTVKLHTAGEIFNVGRAICLDVSDSRSNVVVALVNECSVTEALSGQSIVKVKDPEMLATCEG